MARAGSILVYCAVLLLWMVCRTPLASADDIRISAAIDKTEASLDDVVILQVSVEGTRSEPRMPDLGGDFRIQSRGTSSQMSIINGRMSTKLEYNYTLYPQKVGIFTIPPFTLGEGGATNKSNPLQIKITAAEAQPRDTGDVFVTASVDTETPYLNQQIVYTFQFCRRVKVASASLTEQPSFDGFLVESLGKEREFQKIINGKQYIITEIRQALFPLKTGVLEISPTTLQAAVVAQSRSRRGRGSDPFFDDSFFGFTETIPRQFRTAPIKVSVRPLPDEGRPADFKNLVGEFSLTTQLSSTSARVGDSLTLTITVEGTGSLKNLQTFDLGPVDNFKVYDDKPAFEQSAAGGRIGGRLMIKKALVPLAAGNLEVPAAALSYFDTATKSYKRLQGTAYTVQVQPSAGGEKLDIMQGSATAQKQEIELLGRDILPLHGSAGGLRQENAAPSAFIIIAAAFLPPLLCLSLVGMRRVRERSAGDPAAAHQKKAYKRFIKHISTVKKAIEDERLFYPAGAKALKDFIGDRLAVPGQALTARDLESLLAEKVPAERIAELKGLMDFFDAGQFGFSTVNAAQRKHALERLQKAVYQLNRELRA